VQALLEMEITQDIDFKFRMVDVISIITSHRPVDVLVEMHLRPYKGFNDGAILKITDAIIRERWCSVMYL
jgi:hypothetical protein